MKISEKTKTYIAYWELVGSVNIWSTVYSIDALRKIVYHNPFICIPYHIALAYCIIDGSLKGLHPKHEGLTEKIVRNVRTHIKFPFYFPDKKPIKEKEAREKHRWYEPLFHTLFLKSI